MTTLGLRIDVDTFRGTRDGVLSLCRLFAEHDITASFFFSVGPDNMGRHLWRLLRPSFLKKMLRSNASKLYGWDILLRGTLMSGPVIGKNLSHIIQKTFEAGHEIGFHAWDHHQWQAHIETMTQEQIYDYIRQGIDMIAEITGNKPLCSAAPAWKCNDQVLIEKDKFSFQYNSDCRGTRIFYPIVNGKKLSQPQVPVTLPTYDEIIGKNSISDENYNDYLLSLIKPDQLNVLTIHAEAEGIACLKLFEQFVIKAKHRDISFVPLGKLLNLYTPTEGHIVAAEIIGRDGWAACQQE